MQWFKRNGSFNFRNPSNFSNCRYKREGSNPPKVRKIAKKGGVLRGIII